MRSTHPKTTKIQTGWLIGLSAAVLLASAGSATAPALPANDDMAAGLKDALHVGIENVVGQVSQLDGFNADSEIHIPLPGDLGKVVSKLEKLGMSSAFEDLELGLNRAAELASTHAKDLFQEAIMEMTLEDAKDIFTGEDDAATRYLESKMSEPLAEKMRPVVEESLSEVGAAKVYGDIMDRYQSLPFVSDVELDLPGYVVEKGMDGIFYYLAREEAAIRHDPAKRATDLLKRVFGAD